MASEIQNGISSWCTKNFLENALQKRFCNPDISVISFEIEKATASGDNYLSEMYRVIIQTNENGHDTISLVIKCTPQEENTKKFVSDLGLFGREFQALKVVLPELHGLLEEVAPGEYQPFAATCLILQEVENRTVIVLDDLKAQGFKMAQRRLGLDLDHCILVIKTLARLHGTSATLYRRDPSFLDRFLVKPGLDSNNERTDKVFAESINSLADEIDTWVDSEEMSQYSERLRKFASCSQNKVKEAIFRKEEEFNVLMHGDCWINNIMFKYDDTNQPKDIRFVDLQLAYWTSPAPDLLYFLHTSPKPELHDKHQFLLEVYHNELGKTLQMFNLKHIQPTFQELLNMMNQRYCFAFFASVVALPFMLRDPNNAVNIDEMLKDEDKADVSKQNFHRGVELKRAYKTFIPTFAEKGLF